MFDALLPAGRGASNNLAVSAMHISSLSSFWHQGAGVYDLETIDTCSERIDGGGILTWIAVSRQRTQWCILRIVLDRICFSSSSRFSRP